LPLDVHTGTHFDTFDYRQLY